MALMLGHHRAAMGTATGLLSWRALALWLALATVCWPALVRASAPPGDVCRAAESAGCKAQATKQYLEGVASLEGLLVQGRAKAASEQLAAIPVEALAIPERVKLLNTRARVAKHRRRFREAYTLHRQVLHIRSVEGATAEGYLAANVEIATDLLLDFRYEDALDTIVSSRRILRGDLPPDALALMDRVQSHVHDCAGNYSQAILASKRAAQRPLAPPPTAPDLVREALMWARWRATVGASTQYAAVHSAAEDLTLLGAPRTASETRGGLLSWLATKEAGAREQVLHTGRWPGVEQTPTSFLPTLPRAAWPAPDKYPQIAMVARRLASSHAQLLSELDDIAGRGLLDPDRDCIQAPISSRDGKGGQWGRYEITGVWNHLVRGCSDRTPAACALLAELRSMSDRLGSPAVLRAGYSVVGPGAWIRPHFGPTNGQLKLHLGLRIPTAGSDNAPQNEPCVWIRVGHERRVWPVGGTLLFDDSFEHEVRNDCAASRSVFQVVLRHPLLPPPERPPGPVVQRS